MKSTGFILLAALFIYLLTGCTANTTPGANGNTTAAANTNANAAKPVPVAPTADLLLSMDKQANEAYIKGDSKYFEGFLSDKFVMGGGGMRLDKAALVKMIGENKCTVKDGWALEDPKMSTIDADTVVISYKATFDGTCAGPDGKQMKVPSPVRSASIYIREGDKWKGAWHGETLIPDPKAPQKAPPPMPPSKDQKPATGDANTDALVKVETAGWEAWKANDAAKLGSLVSDKLAGVSMEGTWMGTKADVLKYWTEMKCDVKSVSVTDGVASAFSPTVEILTFKGTAVGTCGANKLGPAHGTSVYVKEGNDWKLAFTFEEPGS